MHATLRRMKCAPGQAPEVARLIEAYEGDVLTHTTFGSQLPAS
jgi:hypothetical protein